MNEIIFKINEDGDKFYKKWTKDAKMGVFVATPLMLLFYSTVGLLIFGFGSKFVFILIGVAFLIFRAFVSPYFARKELINHSLKRISIENGIIFIETLKYLNHPPICFSFSPKEARLDFLKTHSFFKDTNAWLLTIGNSEEQKFYIIEEFFDTSLEPLKSIFNR